MDINWKTVGTLSAVVVAASAARADLLSVSTLNAEARGNASVSTSAGSDGDNQSLTTGLFGELPLNAGASASVLDGFASGNAMTAGSRGLHSVTAFGEASGSASAPDTGSASGFGESTFVFEFTLGSAVDFVLEWALHADGSGNLGLADLVLFDEANNAVFTRTTDTAGTIEGIETGDLLPGAYRLQLYAGASGFGGGTDGSASASARYEVTLTVVPAPGALAILGAGLLARRRRR